MQCLHIAGVEGMDEKEWVVTLTFKTNVKGAKTKDEAISGANEQIKREIVSGKGAPIRATARKVINLAEEEHLFGIQYQ